MPAKNLAVVFNLLFVLVVAISCDQDPSFDLSTPNSAAYTGPSPNVSVSLYDRDANMVTLGRVLFYDKALSINNTVACASCHKQSLGFGDNEKFSEGVAGLTLRNTIAIQNLSLLPAAPAPGYGSAEATVDFPIGGFFWDGREASLDKLVLQPVLNHIEMGTLGLDFLSQKLSRLPYYKPLFKGAYFDQSITPDKISEALVAFLKTINTSRSRFDDLNQGVNSFSAQQMEGLSLFRQKYDCNRCHQIEVASASVTRFANIGLDMQYGDRGLARVTGSDGDVGKFKVPSLRNVELTAPYMHDGRFATLEEVIQHYSERIVDHPNLHSDLKDENGLARKMNISEEESQALIAFLKTLTDKSALTDPKLSDPFKTK